MGDLIPSVTITEFLKLLKVGVKGMKSVEVTFNGEHYFTVIIPVENDPVVAGNLQVMAERLAARSNNFGKLEPDEVKEKADALV